MYALILYVLAALAAIRGKDHNRDNAKNEARNNAPSLPIPLPVIHVLPTPSDEERAKQKQKDSRDKWIFRVEVTGLIVLMVYAGFTVALWWQNKRAADAAAEQLRILSEARDRPWIKFSEDTITLDNGVVFKPSGDGVSMALEHTFRLENIGKIPAINYSVWAEPTYWANGEVQQHFWSTTTCNSAKKNLRVLYRGAEIKGAAIFPGPAVESRASGSLFIPGAVHEIGYVYIGVCAAYEEPNGEVRSTAFLYCQQGGDGRRTKVLDKPEVWWQSPTATFKVCSVDVDDPHRKK
jgi:hypothetical protein